MDRIVTGEARREAARNAPSVVVVATRCLKVDNLARRSSENKVTKTKCEPAASASNIVKRCGTSEARAIQSGHSVRSTRANCIDSDAQRQSVRDN